MEAGINMKSINVEGGFAICGGWNFSKSVSVDSTFIRERRVGDSSKVQFFYKLKQK